MEIGKKIRALRVKKGVTQETLAEALLVSSQAVSKWENEQSAPDIQLLPEIAVYFGVTVDELFSLSEEKEYDRIQNMLWDERVVSQSEADRAERWLLGKIKEGWRAADCYVLLADLYNHRAYSMHEQAAEYAKAALAIGEEGGLTQIKDAHGELCDAMDGFIPDWCARNHHKLIDYYRDYLEKHPQDWRAHMWLLDNLIDDNRLAEAEEVGSVSGVPEVVRRGPVDRHGPGVRRGVAVDVLPGVHRQRLDVVFSVAHCRCSFLSVSTAILSHIRACHW